MEPFFFCLSLSYQVLGFLKGKVILPQNKSTHEISINCQMKVQSSVCSMRMTASVRQGMTDPSTPVAGEPAAAEKSHPDRMT